MMIRKFNQITGSSLENITGQSRFAFSLSDFTDFYDLPEWEKTGGYKGSVLTFYDCRTGDVCTPFPQEKNVVCGKPQFLNGFLYVLRGDYDRKRLTLYRSTSPEAWKVETELDMEQTELYNLRILGNEVHIVSHNERFACYYPEVFSFLPGENETAVFIDNGKVYCEAWVEEGWDENNHCETENYRYYNKVIVRDFSGNVLSEEAGSLYQNTDGSWWIG